MKKRAAMNGSEVRAALLLRTVTTLSSFKSSVEAYEVSAFDGWRGRTYGSGDTASPAQLWEAIEKLDCFDQDWNPFRTRLISHGESEVACRCGAHFVTVFLIRGRWSLLILGRQSLIAPPLELLPVRTKTMETLGRILTELAKGTMAEPPPGAPSGGDGGAGPAELGIPLWWVRRSN